MDSFANFDRWPEMSTGDEEGRRIMKELISMQASRPIASVIEDLEAEGKEFLQ